MPEPIWLSRILLDQMHAELIREHGGSPGIRDANLIESALARPQNKWAYGEEDIVELVAASGYGLARNHGYDAGGNRGKLVGGSVIRMAPFTAAPTLLEGVQNAWGNSKVYKKRVKFVQKLLNIKSGGLNERRRCSTICFRRQRFAWH